MTEVWAKEGRMSDHHNPRLSPGRPPLSGFRSGSPTTAEGAACPLLLCLFLVTSSFDTSACPSCSATIDNEYVFIGIRKTYSPWQLRKWQPAYVGLATSALPTHSEFPWPRKNPSVFQRRRWLLSQPSLSRGYHAAQCVPWYAWRPPGDGSSSCSISSVPKQPRGRN